METQILIPAAAHAKHFKSFIQLLVGKFQPLQIYCFSKSISFMEKQGCYSNESSSYNCNYCLLVVTENVTRIDYEVQDFANSHYQHGTITILCHGLENITDAIKANNRFFITTCASKQLIYSHDGLSNFDSSNPFIPTQSAIKAQNHSSHHMPLAEGFLNGATECLSKEQYTVCVFLLHQVVEQSLIALIRVHLAYRSEIHNLGRMLGLCRAFSERPIQLLLSGSTEDKRLFDVLTKSYSGARYAKNFTVNGEDAKAIFKKVYAFQELTKEMCGQKIEQLVQEAMIYKELHHGIKIADGQFSEARS
ncbi:HEPN domain-containing protein [Pedobacter sp. L105]|uniref:HEPN domain-containing protein n=1 Tax=Pedobacter sp. L105 TaxID=1641871 RepID=UPI00131E3107|nr:HEPN domain-containing protein [Pedobacter sp. L105]